MKHATASAGLLFDAGDGMRDLRAMKIVAWADSNKKIRKIRIVTIGHFRWVLVVCYLSKSLTILSSLEH